jgi:diguanylate cyclase (GGDEF)-like protein
MPSTAPFLPRPAVEALINVTRDLAKTTDLQKILDIITEAAVTTGGYESAVINMVDDAGDLYVASIKAPPSAHEALADYRAPRARWERILVTARPYRGLLLVRDLDVAAAGMQYWKDEQRTVDSDHEDAWLPEYALFAPLVDSTATGTRARLIGVISLDSPVTGRLPSEVQATIIDVIARQAEQAIIAARTLARFELNERVFRMAFESSPSLTAIIDPLGNFVNVNWAFSRAFSAVSHAREFDRLVKATAPDTGLVRALERVFSGDLSVNAFEAAFNADAGCRWFKITVRGIAHTSLRPERVVCTIVDISTERREQLRHQHDAQHDPLTGLLNRRGAREAMDDVVHDSSSEPLVVVMACDLDEFKSVNDQWGHNTGDLVLIEAAHRLREVMPGESALVRLGGDEFLVVVRCPDESSAQSMADGLVTAMTEPIKVADVSLTVTMSVGLALVKADEIEDISIVVDAADRALYAAKSAGRARWEQTIVGG